MRREKAGWRKIVIYIMVSLLLWANVIPVIAAEPAATSGNAGKSGNSKSANKTNKSRKAGKGRKALTAIDPAAVPVTVNKGQKKVKLFKPGMNLSADPQDQEITAIRIFPEPLIPMSGEAIAGENVALRKALLAFQSKKNLEDVSDLMQFMESYPKSRWRASLELNTGLRRFETGYVSDALSLWESAWQNSKAETKPEQKAVADEAIAQLLVLNARLGRMEELKKYFAEIENRSLYGSVEEKVRAAKEGLLTMQYRPERAFKCGPLAVNTLWQIDKQARGRAPELDKAASTTEGTSLAQLQEWAEQLGLKYQVAKRSKGAVVLFPAVMHWRAGHFAAIAAKNGDRYQIKDPTFGQGGNMWISEKAIDAEGDGYFLVPQGELPSGWTPVERAEAAKVWGKGGVELRDYNSQTVFCPKTRPFPNGVCGKGMAELAFNSMQATTNIYDIPVGYRPPIGPRMDFRVNYNYLEANQPSLFTFPNMGPNWSFNWVSYLTLDASKNATVMVRGGGSEIYNYVQPDNVTNPYAPNLTSQAVLSVAAAGVYHRELPDGSIEVFNQSDGSGRIFMTQVIDPQGNSAYIQYDSNFRITGITDALGQVSTLTYVSNTLGNSGYYKISKVTDPFSRFASFAYDSTNTYLLSITDVIGLASRFLYDSSSSFITLMTTPYGSTSLYSYTPNVSGFAPTGIKITFPDGSAAAIESWIAHALQTYYWDRQALAMYPFDPSTNLGPSNPEPNTSHCEITEWQVESDLGNEVMSPVPNWNKLPLENRTLFTYEGQTPTGEGDHAYVGFSNKPKTVSRKIDETNTQTWQYEYNAFGRVTKAIDPIGRTFSFAYAANNVDLLEKREVKGGNNFLIGKWQYNNEKHLPNVYIDGSGQRTQYAYNSYGELTTITDANNDTTTMTYDSDGYLMEVEGPLAGNDDKTTMTYDGYGRLYTITDSEGYVLTFNYDAADRLTKITYPDGTAEETKYDRLDAILLKDRLGRWSQRAYDSMDQLVYEIDPLSRKTQYKWCSCGSLSALIDPAGNKTQWHHDLEGRLTEKVYANGTEVTSSYDVVGRLAQVIDALNQKINYSYNLDNTPAQKSYADAVHATSTVTYSYDQNYVRLASIVNGWGTVSYSYNPYITDPFGTPTTGGGMLQSMTNSVITNSDITFTYDVLGRVMNRSINGGSNSDTWTYDAMSRITAETNMLGNFTYSYVDNTPGSSKGVLRLASIGYPNSQAVNFSWYNNVGDQRLQQISNLNPSTAILSQFGYSYNAPGEITGWSQKRGSQTAVQYSLGYDLASQLVSVQAVSGTPAPPYLNQYYFYAYDPASNRVSVQANGAQIAAIGGAVTASDVLTLTIHDSALGGGQEAVPYTVQSGDSLSDIASGLANAINSNSNLQGINVTASAVGTAVDVLSKSVNATTMTSSTSGGATETITLSNSASIVQAGYNNVNELIATAPGGLARFQASTNKAIKSAQITTNVVSLISKSANATTYAQSTSGGATETITLGPNVNGSSAAKVEGTVTPGDVLTITITNGGLPGGQKAKSYTAQSGDSVRSLAMGLAAAINSDVDLQAAGISANGGIAATLGWTKQFSGNSMLMAGENTADYAAIDGGNNPASSIHGVRVDSGASVSFSHDANGNMTSDGTNSYEWDVEDRLIKIVYPGADNYTELMYDGLGRRVKIVETVSGSVTSTKQYVYCQTEICEERDGTGAIARQFFPRGERISGTNYFYGKDHLGSVREMTNVAGVPQAEYEYDPWGKATKLGGAQDATFQYAGYYKHERSGLNLTLYRAYAPVLGRWLSRDPLGEDAGTNLFAYVGNDPSFLTDPYGLDPWKFGPIGNWLSQPVTEKRFAENLAIGYLMAMPVLATEIAIAGVPVRACKTARFITGSDGKTVDLKPTLDRIAAKGSHPHINDATTFKNNELMLPKHPTGYYTEYVHPTYGINHAGPQRIITGKGGELYYSPDHYKTFIPLN